MVDINMGSTPKCSWGALVEKFGAAGSSTTAVDGWGSECTLHPQTMDGRDNIRQESSSRSWQMCSQPLSEKEIILEVLTQDCSDTGYGPESNGLPHQPDDGSNDDEDSAQDSDDDTSDDYDSDASQKRCEMRNNNKWFKALFQAINGLTAEEINEQSRRWHCPACHDGPGAIKAYRGLQSLLAHAKTKLSPRVKLHRLLAELLEEDLQRKGISTIPDGEAFYKLKGLPEPIIDHEIVWPPMVAIMDPLNQKDDNSKRLSMGTQELLQYFNDYAAVKARHSYGPNGHKGLKVLIFETSAMGYWEAARLHNHFLTNEAGRDAWELCQEKFNPDAIRQLYGYLACEKDIDIFNQHSEGKPRLKFQMRSYRQMVVLPMKQMRKDNEGLAWFKRKAVKQEQHLRVLEEILLVVKEMREKTKEQHLRVLEEILLVVKEMREKTKEGTECKEEMDYQKKFFEEKIARVHETVEKIQEELAKGTHSSVDYETDEDQHQRPHSD